MAKEKAYFSHPIRTYNSKSEKNILNFLNEKYEVVNPADITIPRLNGCINCMQAVMKKVFFPLIEECDVFAVWMPIPTCGILCEAHYAAQLGKKMVYIEYPGMDIEDTTLRELLYLFQGLAVEEVTQND